MSGLDYVRERCCSEINRHLVAFAMILESEGANNLMSSRVYAEDSAAALLNCAFDYDLVNANIFEHNATCFDLRDDNNKVIVQVSTDQSRAKINHTLGSNRLPSYQGYTMRFFFLCTHQHSYQEPYPVAPQGISFELGRDVFNIPGFIGIVKSLEIDKIKSINKICRQEFGWKPNPAKLAHGLSAVVLKLGEHELVPATMDPAVAFAIDEKIQLNELDYAAEVIREYSAYAHELSSIYDEYAKAGNNRMLSLFQRLKRRYGEALRVAGNKDEAFFVLIDRLCEELAPEVYNEGFAEEELESYVTIVVSDAFMRCIVFDGPNTMSLPQSAGGLTRTASTSLLGDKSYATD